MTNEPKNSMNPSLAKYNNWAKQLSELQDNQKRLLEEKVQLLNNHYPIDETLVQNEKECRDKINLIDNELYVINDVITKMDTRIKTEGKNLLHDAQTTWRDIASVKYGIQQEALIVAIRAAVDTLNELLDKHTTLYHETIEDYKQTFGTSSNPICPIKNICSWVYDLQRHLKIFSDFLGK